MAKQERVKREQGLLTLYREYTAQGEVPERYHTWSLIAVAGHLMGRRVFVRGGNRAFFPGQMMVVLVGPSGVHKSSAIEDAVGLLEVIGREKANMVNVLPDRASPSVMIHRMNPLAKGKLQDLTDTAYPGVDAVGFIRASEMGAYFSQEGFLETMATHITNLNDAKVGPWNDAQGCFEPAYHEITFMQAPSQTLWNPCIGMLAGTTPDGLASELPVAARTGGFLARVILVYVSESERDPRCILDMNGDAPKQAGLQDQILKGLVQLTRITGQARFTEEATKAHRDWYLDNHPKFAKRLGALQLDTTGKIGGYLNRRESHMLRTYMILAALAGCTKERKDGSLELWVKRIHVEVTQRLLLHVEEGFEHCLKYFGSEERGGLDGRLLRQFQNWPDRWWGRLKLLQAMHKASRGRWKKRMVDEALTQLLAVQGIEVQGKYPHTEYRLKLSKWDGVKEATGKQGKLSLTPECSDAYEDAYEIEEEQEWSDNVVRFPRSWIPSDC